MAIVKLVSERLVQSDHTMLRGTVVDHLRHTRVAHDRGDGDNVTWPALGFGPLDHTRKHMLKHPKLRSEIDVDESGELGCRERGDRLRVGESSIIDDDGGDAMNREDRLDDLFEGVDRGKVADVGRDVTARGNLERMFRLARCVCVRKLVYVYHDDLGPLCRQSHCCTIANARSTAGDDHELVLPVVASDRRQVYTIVPKV